MTNENLDEQIDAALGQLQPMKMISRPWRPNAPIVLAIVGRMMKHPRFSLFTSAMVLEILKTTDLRHGWRGIATASAIGDIIGKGFFQFETVRSARDKDRIWVMPDELPTIDGEELCAPAIYREAKASLST